MMTYRLKSGFAYIWTSVRISCRVYSKYSSVFPSVLPIKDQRTSSFSTNGNYNRICSCEGQTKVINNRKLITCSSPSKICGRRHYSDSLKDDEEVKKWINEIKKDFGVEEEITAIEKNLESIESVFESSDSESSSSDSDSDSESDEEKSETLVQEQHADAGKKQNQEREIEDFTVEWTVETDVEPEWEPPVSLTRGKTGVFELEELVKVVKDAKGLDVCVIQLPMEVQFSEYMVIVSALSTRHMKAIAADIKWLYKRRKAKGDRFLKVEGEDTTDWFAMDLGNIVLHIFLPATRQLYDLESLWTLGPEFDPQCQQQGEERKYLFSAEELPWLAELEEKTRKSKGQSSKVVK